MAVTVSVAATWRMSRVEFITPYAPTGLVMGHGEVLLQEPAEPSPEAAKVLRTPMATSEGEVKTYGVMPGGSVMRNINDVLSETIEVDGLTLTFAQAMDAMEAFLRRWREEDGDKPSMMVPPPGVPVTPMTTTMPPPNTVPPPPPPA
jgi:hypothetical protein